MSLPVQLEYPVIRDIRDFDQQSGSMVERWIFNHRAVIVLLCVLATLVLGFQTTKLHLNASFEKTMPTEHPYIINYLRHQKELKGSGNVIRIAVETQHGSIFDASYLGKLQRINDEVFLIPGVDRSYMKSLWT